MPGPEVESKTHKYASLRSSLHMYSLFARESSTTVNFTFWNVEKEFFALPLSS